MANSLVKNHDLTISGLGRGINNQATDKSNINRADRIVGNEKLFHEALLIQSALAKQVIGYKTKPIILVDWSSATVAERYQLLRAAVALKGRSITLYEEVHPLSKYNNPEVHKAFLERLHTVLPAYSKPIVVTDAGFSTPWFKQVLQLGWDYVGRIINKSYYLQENTTEWGSIPELLKYRSTTVRSLGKVALSKTHSFECYLHVYKERHKGRVRKNAYGDKASKCVSKRCAKSSRNAWVLATSLGEKYMQGQKAVKIYAARMQIEESFRDIKSPRYGFGLRHSRTLGIKRLTNLFLIGLIGIFLAWMIGLCAKAQNLQFSFQTNSIKHRNVLSVFNIGRHAARKGIKFLKSELLNALKYIQELACELQDIKI